MKIRQGLLLFAVVLTFQLPADGKKKICILAPVHSSTDQTLNVLASTISDTLNLTLSLMGDFQISTPETPQSLEEFLKAPVQEDWEKVIYGNIRHHESGGIKVELAVFEKNTNTTSIRRDELSETVLEIFDVTDQIVQDLIDFLAGSPVVYGKIRLNPGGYPGDYKLFINDYFAGSNIRSMDKIPQGTHQIRITADLEGEREVFHHELEIFPGTVSSIDFTIPELNGQFYSVLDDFDTRYMLTSSAEEESLIPELQQILYRMQQMKPVPLLSEKYEKYLNSLDAFIPEALPERLPEEVRNPYVKGVPLSDWTGYIAWQDENTRVDGVIGQWLEIPPFLTNPDVNKTAEPGEAFRYVKLRWRDEYLYVMAGLNELPEKTRRLFYVLNLSDHRGRTSPSIELRVQNDRNNEDQDFSAYGFIEKDHIEIRHFRWLPGYGYEAVYGLEEIKEIIRNWEHLYLNFEIVSFEPYTRFDGSPWVEVPGEIWKKGL